ncbi:tyrosine-type recombinase/integrase [Desulfotomaculum sp. 1211_IL3151]|uniref:tyrosine-type recombinase/integrase n=1 Tax=Desulfotomaculum sp. 1211_IL3151 TaxID=3084055 RepID=UPI002FDA230F
MCKTDYQAIETLNWGKAVNMFLMHLEYDLNRSSETIRGYRKDLYHFGSCMIDNHGPKFIPKKVGPMDIWLYLRHLSQDHKYAPRSRARNLASIKSFYNFLKLNDLIKKDPSQNIQWPTLPQNEQPIYFTVEDFHKIISVIDLKDHNQYIYWVMIHVLFLTGMRISEVLSLKCKDVDIINKIIYVREGKGNKNRTIPISKSLNQVLSDYFTRHGGSSDAIFFLSMRSDSGQISPQCIRRIIKKYCHLAGVEKAKLSPHVFRHGFATTLYMDKGVDLLRIATLLGHSSTRTTEIYAHTNEDHLRKAVDLIDI